MAYLDSPKASRQRKLVSQASSLHRDLRKTLAILYPSKGSAKNPSRRAQSFAATATGKNVGSFKTREGSYVKGKGGRFVGSKG